MSSGVDPDQDRNSPVGPDLGPNSLSKLSADYKSCRQQGSLNRRKRLSLSFEIFFMKLEL